MNPKLIFDFDGTIADTFELLFDIASEFAEQYDIKSIKENKEKFRGQTIKAILKSLDIPLVRLPILVKQITHSIYKHIDKLQPIPGIKESLYDLKKENYSLNIITSNSKKNIEQFLKKNNLEIFDIIYSSSIFGKHRSIKKFLKAYNIEPTEAIYIGDEVRDIEAAKKSNLKIIAVTWGFNDEKILREYNPDYIVKKPSDLIKVING